jgi:pilus assembly protein CpaB
MRKAQLIGVAIAGVCGLGAFVGVSKILNRPVTVVEVKAKSDEVLVAQADIGLGQMVAAGAFRWQAWPQDALGPGYILKSQRPNADSELDGQVVRVPMLQNEPVTENKLIKPGSGGVLAAILPGGMRAISTKISEDTGVGRLILPNDRVDVILIRRLRSRVGGEEHVSDTLFQNVRVLAIGQIIDQRDPNKKSVEGNTATLELTPHQAELLALAKSMGEISLSLRSIADLRADAAALSSKDLRADRGNAIKVLRYGVRSRAYGVN